MNSLAVVNVGYHSSVLNHAGFGYLVPSKEKQKLLGVVWDSSAFPQQNRVKDQTRLTAMIGGSHFNDFTSYRDDELIEMTLRELSTHLSISRKPDFISIKSMIDAIPQYTVGHQKRIKKIDEELKKISPNINLLGNGYYGISVNDCIARSHKAFYDEF